MNPFAERLKKLRSDQHLSQNALAGFIGVSKSSVNMYERSRASIPLRRLQIILRWILIIYWENQNLKTKMNGFNRFTSL